MMMMVMETINWMIFKTDIEVSERRVYWHILDDKQKKNNEETVKYFQRNHLLFICSLPSRPINRKKVVPQNERSID
jgi:hypothetical protein